jgi:peroxiredoxin
MRIIYIVSAFLILQSQMLCAQQNKFLPFEIEGNINADTGVVELQLLFDADYYPPGVENMVAKVENKKFTFSGSILYPQGVTLSYGNVYYSSLFVVEPGTQSVTVDIDAVREVPKVDNQVMKEYEGEYTKAYEQVRLKRNLWDNRRDSLRQVYQNKLPDSINLTLEEEIKSLYAESDSILLKYVTSHPDSYIAFWKFIELFRFVGYENIYDSIFAQFSDTLKNTHAGKVLTEKLKIAGMTGNGKKFPYIAAVDRQKNQINQASFSGHEYTFVDFWFSSCPPCIGQFPHLKDIYTKYKDKGFEVIGISTDRLKDKEKWEEAIQRFELSWPQYWDQDGVASSKLYINKFPTNFLLDNQGKIIKKDLRPVELEQFLLENMR